MNQHTPRPAVHPAVEPASPAGPGITRILLLRHAETVLPRYDWDLAANDTLAVLEEAALGA